MLKSQVLIIIPYFKTTIGYNFLIKNPSTVITIESITKITIWLAKTFIYHKTYIPLLTYLPIFCLYKSQILTPWSSLPDTKTLFQVQTLNTSLSCFAYYSIIFWISVSKRKTLYKSLECKLIKFCQRAFQINNWHFNLTNFKPLQFYQGHLILLNYLMHRPNRLSYNAFLLFFYH